MRKLLRLFGKLLLILSIVAAALLAWLWPRYPYLPATIANITVVRLGDGPIIDASSSESLRAEAAAEGYSNFNFPALIRVPDWIDDPLGAYYLYFSHHKGDHIRLAYADAISGPWKVYEPGTLRLAASGFPTAPKASETPRQALEDLRDNFSIFIVRDYLLMTYRSAVTDKAIREQRGIAVAQDRAAHIASPDIFVDDENQQLYMYYHGLEYGTRQLSRVARSGNGLDFRVLPGTIPSPYLRNFEYRGRHYLLGMPGVLFRGKSPAGPFETRDRLLFDPGMRHAGLWLEDSTLYVIWSRVGDAPERLLLSAVDLSPDDWNDWRATAETAFLRPERPWEGSELPVMPSIRGELPVEANELRDPAVFEDADGQRYLLYVGRGEKAIGIARIARLDD